MGRVAVVCAAVLLCLLATLSARAEEPVATRGVPEAELDARLAELDDYFAQLRRPTRAYTIAWVSGLSALTVAQGVLAGLEDDPAQRTIYIVGGSLSVLGVVVIAVLPRGRHQVERTYHAQPARTATEKAARLVVAEELLHQHERTTQRAYAWYMHLLAGVLGVGVTLSLGLAYDDLWLRATLAGVGAVVGVEARVWTYPTRSLKFGRRYREHWPDTKLAPLAAQGLLGLAVRGAF